MWGDGGVSLTYAVVTDELVAAASAVDAVTRSAAAAEVESLPGLVSEVGHPGLATALREFCGRWDHGLSTLVGDITAMAELLDECAEAYAANEGEPGRLPAAVLVHAGRDGPAGAAAGRADRVAR